MSEMVERVARVIQKEALTNMIDNIADADAELLARAAIEAMRKPTDGQRNNYYNLSHRTETFKDGSWERAIDAALTPSKVNEPG